MLYPWDTWAEPQHQRRGAGVQGVGEGAVGRCGREVDVSDERDASVLQGVGRDEVRGLGFTQFNLTDQFGIVGEEDG